MKKIILALIGICLMYVCITKYDDYSDDQALKEYEAQNQKNALLVASMSHSMKPKVSDDTTGYATIGTPTAFMLSDEDMTSAHYYYAKSHKIPIIHWNYKAGDTIKCTAQISH